MVLYDYFALSVRISSFRSRMEPRVPKKKSGSTKQYTAVNRGNTKTINQEKLLHCV